MKRKLPHFRFPGFKILDRYILGKFLSTYFFAIAMIIVVVVIFDYVEKIDNFTETKAPLKAIIFDYYLNFIPFFINQFSGLFTFIAVIFFTSKMAYQTEIVAMLSGGMSFRRLMWPYFLGALIIASLSLGLNLWLIPVSQRSCVAFENQYIPRKARFQYDKKYLPSDRTRYVRLYPQLLQGIEPGFVLQPGRVRIGSDDRIARSRRGEVQSRNQAVVGPTIYHPHVRFARCGNFHATPQSGHTH